MLSSEAVAIPTKLNIFNKENASDISRVHVFSLQPFYILEGTTTLMHVKLAGTGTKSDSDIDIDMQLQGNNNTILLLCINTLSDIILERMASIAFSYLYDTNFYFSKLWHAIESDQLKIYYVAIIAKLQLRFLHRNNNATLYETNLNLLPDQMTQIVDFYKPPQNKTHQTLEHNFLKVI